MEEVKVEVEELVARLKENRAQHRAIYEEALVGYKDVALAALEEYANKVRGGHVEVISIVLAKPEDHTKEYDRIIAMAEASVDEQVTLSQREFQQYWLDDWDWRGRFLLSNSTYSQTAGALLNN